MTHEEAEKRANEVLADLDDQKEAILRKLDIGCYEDQVGFGCLLLVK